MPAALPRRFECSDCFVRTPNRVTSILGPDKTLRIYKVVGYDGLIVRILTRNEPGKGGLDLRLSGIVRCDTRSGLWDCANISAS
jgi:hypothetical protein